jgi:hypothetical protein
VAGAAGEGAVPESLAITAARMPPVDRAAADREAADREVGVAVDRAAVDRAALVVEAQAVGGVADAVDAADAGEAITPCPATILPSGSLELAIS